MYSGANYFSYLFNTVLLFRNTLNTLNAKHKLLFIMQGLKRTVSERRRDEMKDGQTVNQQTEVHKEEKVLTGGC